MLERLFTSKARVKILGLIIFRPSELHLREISRQTGVSPVYAAKELENLKALGLVSEKRKGNMRLFSANRLSPIFPELKSIFMKTEALPSVLRKGFEDKDIRFMAIYGSFASGKESENSDIDILIIGDVSEKAVSSSLAEFEKNAGREANYILWNEREFMERADKGHALLRDIAEKPLIMLSGDENEFRVYAKGEKDREDKG